MIKLENTFSWKKLNGKFAIKMNILISVKGFCESVVDIWHVAKGKINCILSHSHVKCEIVRSVWMACHQNVKGHKWYGLQSSLSDGVFLDRHWIQTVSSFAQ